MSDTRWKATERRIAALLGGRRVPVSGRGRGDQPDVAPPWFSLEVKDRDTLIVGQFEAGKFTHYRKRYSGIFPP
jgi:hypothetical protein